MLELYNKGKNKLLDVIDSAKTGINRNERIRLQKRLESLLWEVSIHAYKEGHEACDFDRNFRRKQRRKT